MPKANIIQKNAPLSKDKSAFFVVKGLSIINGLPLYIIDFVEIAYHQGESLVYHHCEGGCSLRLMIYTFGDDMPLLSQWIKKFDKLKLVEFLGGDEEI